jgi:hypothetical protein
LREQLQLMKYFCGLTRFPRVMARNERNGFAGFQITIWKGKA